MQRNLNRILLVTFNINLTTVDEFVPKSKATDLCQKVAQHAAFRRSKSAKAFESATAPEVGAIASSRRTRRTGRGQLKRSHAALARREIERSMSGSIVFALNLFTTTEFPHSGMSHFTNYIKYAFCKSFHLYIITVMYLVPKGFAAVTDKRSASTTPPIGVRSANENAAMCAHTFHTVQIQQARQHVVSDTVPSTS